MLQRNVGLPSPRARKCIPAVSKAEVPPGLSTERGHGRDGLLLAFSPVRPGRSGVPDARAWRSGDLLETGGEGDAETGAGREVDIPLGVRHQRLGEEALEPLDR